MKRGTTGALLLLILGLTAVLVFTRFQPWLVGRSTLRAAEAENASRAFERAAERDASTLRIAGDGRLAHWFLGSPEMRKWAGRAGLTVHYVENGDGAASLRKLAVGGCEAVALPVADFLARGSELGFPGVIVAALARERGADGTGSESVDVLVMRREVLRERPETVRVFLGGYFQVLDHYAHNPIRLTAELSRASGLEPVAARAALGRLDFLDLDENRRLQLADVLIAASDLMVRDGRLDADPLGGNPYSILDGAMLAELTAGSVEIDLEPLPPTGWAELEPRSDGPQAVILFASWERELGAAARATLDRLASWIGEHPRCRLRIVGHTASGGDEEENLKLSRDRAEAVRRYLENAHRVSSARLASEGRGSAELPAPMTGESPRAYRDRLSRVEIIALEARPL